MDSEGAMGHNSAPEVTPDENLSLPDACGTVRPGGNDGREGCQFYNPGLEVEHEDAVVLRLHCILQGAPQFSPLQLIVAIDVCRRTGVAVWPANT
jgi:hypothetical protein